MDCQNLCITESHASFVSGGFFIMRHVWTRLVLGRHLLGCMLAQHVHIYIYYNLFIVYVYCCFSLNLYSNLIMIIWHIFSNLCKPTRVQISLFVWIAGTCVCVCARRHLDPDQAVQAWSLQKIAEACSFQRKQPQIKIQEQNARNDCAASLFWGVTSPSLNRTIDPIIEILDAGIHGRFFSRSIFSLKLNVWPIQTFVISAIRLGDNTRSPYKAKTNSGWELSETKRSQ